MEIREANAAIVGELVDVGSTDLAAETPYIREPKVVCDDDKEVGAFGGHGEVSEEVERVAMEGMEGIEGGERGSQEEGSLPTVYNYLFQADLR